MRQDGDCAMTKRPPGVVTVTAVDGVPLRVRWRDRSYNVEQVLAHWIESGAWWHAVARRVGTAAAERIPLSCAVWRVEARGARGSIVVDLAHDTEADEWSLVRIAD